jgi:hypothetical protein
MVPSSRRERPVDCMGGLVKDTIVMRPHFGPSVNRYSVRRAGAWKMLKERINYRWQSDAWLR